VKKKYELGKCDYSGSGHKNCLAVITWEWNGKRFSMQAEIWKPNKSDIYCGGQCVEEVAAFFPGDRKAQRMVEVWKRWHLNDMRAGCEHQRAEGWNKRPIDPSKPLDAYGKHCAGQKIDSWNMLVWIGRDEHPEGLLNEPCPVCGYRYGSAWLREEIPADVAKEIESW
jgi:hypothetical protein